MDIRFRSVPAQILLITCAIFLAFNNAYCAISGMAERTNEGSYYLGPEDVLEISIWNEKELKREVLVRPDGWFSFPLVGEVEALGKTPGKVRREIESKISKYIPDPVVTVLVTKVAAYTIYVIGQVKKPGRFNVGRYVNIMQVLAMAGGLTPFASEDNIKILRKGNGKQRAISFQYSALKNGNKLNQNIVLKAGDVIVVP